MSSSKIRAGVLGYGVIGRRVADAVIQQPDMSLIGVAGRPNSVTLRDARWRGLAVFSTAPPEVASVDERLFEGAENWHKLLSNIDVLLDCTPAGVPNDYRRDLSGYKSLVTIVQGGERGSDCEASFNSMTNYSDATGKQRIRVISCSSTGTTRFLYALHRCFGVQKAFVTLTRRGSDPGKKSKVPFNSLAPTMGQSHHARDVQTVAPHLNLVSISVNCPTTFSHVIRFQVDLEAAPQVEDVVAALRAVPRVVVGQGIHTTAELAEYFNDLGRHRYDRPEIYVFQECLEVHGNTVLAAISVHMESITIPETIDCIRASLGMVVDPWESIGMTDRALGINWPDARYSS